MTLLEIWHAIRIPFLILVLLYVKLWRKPSEKSPEEVSVATSGLLSSADTKQKEEKEKSAPIPVDFTQSSLGSKNVKRFVASKARGKVITRNSSSSSPEPSSLDSKVIIFYSTLTGSSERYAKKLHERLSLSLSNKPEIQNLDYMDDFDPYFVSLKKDLKNTVYLFVVPSYETESSLDYFIETLKETYNDFRVDSKPLAGLSGFSVFGIGDQESWPEENKFCYQAKIVDKYLGKLGARRIFPLGTGCIKTDIDESIAEYMDHLESTLGDPSPSLEEDDIADSDDEEEEEETSSETATLVDVEDMGRIIKNSKKAETTTVKEMVSKDSPTFKSLTKQGYTVVGSHSGVKICRWTKSALRGRGSCYKYSFYGIRSHLCMEATPSLSCSNKCVFCWRHGTNPVGTTWRWQVDEPEVILKGALEGHYKKIKQLKGVPGVVASRFTEAFTVRHCALSLVGEPIFYPHINRFVEMLHEKHISSFLVCNAQHPAELEQLKRVTQLYVSIDAADKDSLKKVDRPLYRDFWERTMKCLDILKKKKTQRTVFRLTLVKDFNINEIEGYADMVERGEPCFIEVKGVTYCGTSKSNPLTMQNVPFYEEVKSFVEQLNARLNSRGMTYGIAAEHAHSCCILIAHTKFHIDGRWHTAINYDKFFNLLESGNETFMPLDYVAPTEEWAVYGSEQGGFNPLDTRFKRKDKKQALEELSVEPTA